MHAHSDVSVDDDCRQDKITEKDFVNAKKEETPPLITRGSAAFKKITLSMFLAGSASFGMLYCVQPILPVFAGYFDITPAESSLSLSCATIMMAIGMLVAGPLSDALGRRKMMIYSLIIASFCTFLCALMNNWYGVLVMRALTGIALSGVSVVAMTYICEEVHPSVLPFSMGLYISGNAIGSVSGRLITSLFSDYTSWHLALSVTGGISLICAIMFYKLVPESRQFVSVKTRPDRLALIYRKHWQDLGLPWLFGSGAVLMGTFVSLFNYVSYRLSASPFHVSQSVIGLLSVVYLSGTISSPRAGILSNRYGKGPVLLSAFIIMLTGLVVTMFNSLWIITIGLIMVATGFFAGHSIASS